MLVPETMHCPTADGRHGPPAAAGHQTSLRSPTVGRLGFLWREPSRRNRVQRDPAILRIAAYQEASLLFRESSEIGLAQLYHRRHGRPSASRKNPKSVRCKIRPSYNTSSATDRDLRGRSFLELPSDAVVRCIGHQSLPFTNVLAHEDLVGGRSLDRAIGERFKTIRNAETSVHVDPFIFDAFEAALNLFEVGQIVDLAEIRKALLRAHAKSIDVV